MRCGSQASITANIESQGTNLLFIRPGSTQQGGVNQGQGQAAHRDARDHVLAARIDSDQYVGLARRDPDRIAGHQQAGGSAAKSGVGRNHAVLFGMDPRQRVVQPVGDPEA